MGSFQLNWSRRGFLRSMTAGSALMPSLIGSLAAADAGRQTDPLAPHAPHYEPKAKNVIFLYFSGGVSHIDSWDYKPRLFAEHGKPYSVDNPEGKAINAYTKGFIKRPNWEFSPRGQSGTQVSDLFPKMGNCVDDIALIRSMHTSHQNHYNATLGMHTGSFTFARPSMGSWVSYGLGTEKETRHAISPLASSRFDQKLNSIYIVMPVVNQSPSFPVKRKLRSKVASIG